MEVLSPDSYFKKYGGHSKLCIKLKRFKQIQSTLIFLMVVKTGQLQDYIDFRIQ